MNIFIKDCKSIKLYLEISYFKLFKCSYLQFNIKLLNVFFLSNTNYMYLKMSCLTQDYFVTFSLYFLFNVILTGKTLLKMATVKKGIRIKQFMNSIIFRTYITNTLVLRPLNIIKNVNSKLQKVILFSNYNFFAHTS